MNTNKKSFDPNKRPPGADDKIKSEVAYEAMRIFIESFWERGGRRDKEDIPNLLSWTYRHGQAWPVDPAMWEDWLKALRTAVTKFEGKMRP